MEWLSEKIENIKLNRGYIVKDGFFPPKLAEQLRKLALDGNIPVSIFPRWNFVLLAMNQLINHLDKVNIMSNNGFKTKAIIRTGVGSQRPLHPQYQHIGDFTDMVRKMCSSLDVIQLNEPEDIFPSYKKALDRDDGRSTILVEFGDHHNEK